jgi:serine protease inhibitor
MEQFVRRHGRRRGVRLLLTFVRADFDGSMIKALKDKGWHCAGKMEPGQAGNQFVDQVYHDTYVGVDERGTEAAAATGSVVNPVSTPPTLLDANRPFLFLVRDRPTGTVLFAGHVVDASAAQE